MKRRKSMKNKNAKTENTAVELVFLVPHPILVQHQVHAILLCYTNN